jgi:hypothetical protein
VSNRLSSRRRLESPTREGESPVGDTESTLLLNPNRNSCDRTLRGEACERSVGPELVVVKRERRVKRPEIVKVEASGRDSSVMLYPTDNETVLLVGNTAENACSLSRCSVFRCSTSSTTALIFNAFLDEANHLQVVEFEHVYTTRLETQTKELD